KYEIKFSAMDRMNLSPNEREQLTKCFQQWPNVEKFCSNYKTLKNSEIYLFFKDYGAVPLVYWLTCLKTPDTRRLIIEHLEVWTNVKGTLTGKDLQAMGFKGKQIGDKLNEIKLAIIDGQIKTPDEEADFISLSL
ncbi:MAG: hypothetical protein IJJ09_06195, partial [Synergistaceae bacterium]|nr:hypothetical protein [Synergistaceae bacterium]